jgi:DNA-binding NtrC family response regulator
MTTSRTRVLIADDKDTILSLFRKILWPDFDVETAADGAQAISLAVNGDFDVVVSDIRMPGADGFELLREVKRARPEIEVVLMTAFGTIDKAVEAMKQGAYDYLAKPFDPDEALLTVTKAAERKRLRDEARDLRRALAGSTRFEGLVGRSEPMRKVFELMARAAASDVTVMVTGESGTGKEGVARGIHHASERQGGPFVAINCGAIPENLVESELFGHVRGAFTGAATDRRGLFEEASHGTVFLDEIAELPLSLQVKLNRALQERAIRPVGAAHERKVDVRVIAATNVDLRAAVAEGRFREDLFFRLNVFPIRLPSLAERADDIPLLAAHFLDVHQRKPGHATRATASAPAVEGFSADALAALLRYAWPGNVRELENAVERALAVTDERRVHLEALPDEVVAGPAAAAAAPLANGFGSSLAQLTYRKALEVARDRASREYLEELLRQFGGNVTRAAQHAGMERESLHRLVRRYGLSTDAYRDRGE